jgi:hypothetical protein
MALRRGKAVISSGQLDAELRELVAEAARQGKRAEQAAVDAGVEALPGRRKAADLEQTVAEIREALEEEVTIAHDLEVGSGIEPTEQELEIAKRALVHIKLPTLRQIARELHLPDGGNLDAVTDVIARNLRCDKEAIAELVIRHEDEDAPPRDITSRLFQLWEEPDDLQGLAQRLDYICDRYIRTGIARWFIVRKVKATPQQLRLDGVFRYIRADAAQFDEDLTLTADEQNAPARLTLRVGEPIAQVESKGEPEAKALLAAFEGSSSMRRRKTLTPAMEVLRGRLATWHLHSVFLVDLLQSRFGAPDLDILDLSVATFRTERGVRRMPSEEEERRPGITSVRFEGRHLLDSRPACELLSAGQQLVQLGMTVRFSPDGGEDFVLPLSVKLASDHVVVVTGFGVVSPQVSQKLHSTVAAGIRDALRRGIADPPALERLARQVGERAEGEEDPSRPTIFGPGDDGAEEGHEDDEE